MSIIFEPAENFADEMSKHLVMLADWIAVSMEEIYFEAQVVANQELDEIEEEILRIVDLEEAQKQATKSPKGSVLSKDVKIEEPILVQESEEGGLISEIGG